MIKYFKEKIIEFNLNEKIIENIFFLEKKYDKLKESRPNDYPGFFDYIIFRADEEEFKGTEKERFLVGLNIVKKEFE